MPGERGTKILLERDQELELLDATIEQAAEGGGATVLVHGPAGIGKSELLAVTASRARDAGFEELRARGGEFERSFAFGVARQLFAGKLEDPAERESLLAGGAGLAAPALLVEVDDLGTASSGMPLGDPAASIQHGLHLLVGKLADRAPVLIAVDDVQWSDPESGRWLLYLARRLADLPALLLLAARDGEPGLDPEVLTALEAEAGPRVLKPATLSKSATTELIHAQLDPAAEEEFCRAAHQAAGGNPLYLRELIAAAREAGLPATAEQASGIEDLRPRGISRSVLARIDRLGEEAGAVARGVAILGDGAQARVVAALLEQDASDVSTGVEALVAAGILAPGETLGFAHPLIRSAVYEAIPEPLRAIDHARAAGVLADGGAGPEEVAAQLLRAEPGTVPRAIDALRAAAGRAMSRSAPQAAVAYLRRAFREPEARSVRSALLRELMVAATRAADMSALNGISEDPAAELSNDPETLLDRDGGSALVAWRFYTGRISELDEQAALGIAAAREAGEHALALEWELLSLAVVDVSPEEAVRRLERHRAGLEPDSQEERIWFAMRGWWQHMLGGSAKESAELARRGIDRGQLLEFPNPGPVFGQALLVLLRADELDEAEPWIEAMIEDAITRGPPYAMSAYGLRGCLWHMRGELERAVRDATTSVAICREHRIALGLAINLNWLVHALIDRGEVEAAANELATSGFEGHLSDFWWFFPLRYARARLRLEVGRTEEGIDDLRDLLAWRQDTRPVSEPIASTLALALRANGGDPAEIRTLIDLELRAAREWGTPRGIGVALRAQGLVEGGAEGIERLGESVEALRASPGRLELARSLTDLGAALRRCNRRNEARERLREALELATRCGARSLADRARDELAASGAKPRRTMLTGVESLTPSELRVARLAADGMGNREIAQELFVSVKTVETHLGSAYRKLDISSRTDLPAALNGA